MSSIKMQLSRLTTAIAVVTLSSAPNWCAPLAKPSAGKGTRIVITQFGFSQRTLNLAAGPTVILVQNRSGYRQLHLTLDRLGTDQLTVETRLNDAMWPIETPLWHTVVDLKPGRYRVTEANHGWVAEMDVH